MDIEQVARICHQTNRAYCESILDFSQDEWEDAPIWQQESAKGGVEFHINNPTASASASHENWLAQKKAEGWKYGPVKDADKKEHPCFVPYSELPVEQRIKDYLFRAVVHAFLDCEVNHAGMGW